MNYETYEVRVYADGSKFWYQNGQRHRLDGPAIEHDNGDKYWYQNGQRHRLDGPAIEFANGDKFWYQNDQRHRLDGPACEFAYGNKYYYIKGIEYSKEKFDAKVKELKPSCEGKFVEVDGVKYQLVKV
jgi:hypothetical protein